MPRPGRSNKSTAQDGWIRQLFHALAAAALSAILQGVAGSRRPPNAGGQGGRGAVPTVEGGRGGRSAGRGGRGAGASVGGGGGGRFRRLI
jgi:hypothetical protein